MSDPGAAVREAARCKPGELAPRRTTSLTVERIPSRDPVWLELDREPVPAR